MPIYTSPNATDADLVNAVWTSAVATHAAAAVTIAAPQNGGYTFIPQIIAGYSGGAGPFNLTVAPAVGGSTSVSVTGAAGQFPLSIPQFDYTSGSPGTITVTLPDGGVGTVGFLIVGYEYL